MLVRRDDSTLERIQSFCLVVAGKGGCEEAREVLVVVVESRSVHVYKGLDERVLEWSGCVERGDAWSVEQSVGL